MDAINVITAEDVAKIKSGDHLFQVCLDQAAEAEIGCEYWQVSGEGWNGCMGRWPNGRGAFECGGDSSWGDWDDDYLVLDSPGCNGEQQIVDKYGVSCVKVKVDFEHNADDFWAALRNERPEIAEKFGDVLTGKPVILELSEYEAMAAIDGWVAGPEYAPLPVILI